MFTFNTFRDFSTGFPLRMCTTAPQYRNSAWRCTSLHASDSRKPCSQCQSVLLSSSTKRLSTPNNNTSQRSEWNQNSISPLNKEKEWNYISNQTKNLRLVWKCRARKIMVMPRSTSGHLWYQKKWVYSDPINRVYLKRTNKTAVNFSISKSLTWQLVKKNLEHN